MLYYYFVEGECEEALLKAFIHAENSIYKIQPGKVMVFNVLNEKISPLRAMSLKRGSKVVFVYDTDVKKIDTLEENINILTKYSGISRKNIIFLQSNKTFEDEILRCCENLKNINDLFNTKGINEFKNKFVNHKNIEAKLLNVGFDLSKMWTIEIEAPFDKYKGSISSIIEKE